MKPIYLLTMFLVLISTAYPQEQPIITVFDFQYSESIDESEMTSIISLLASELFKTGRYTVIDIQQRDALLGEMQFSLSGLTDEENLLELGKLLSAESIVTGKIGSVGGRMVMSAKMLETETARIESTADGVYNDIGELLDDIHNIALTLAGLEEETKEVLLTENLAAPQIENTGKDRKGLAFGTLGLGVAMMGSGTYLLLDSIDKLNQLKDAENAYMTASSNFDVLYADYLNAYDNAADSNDQFIIGAGLIGGGAVSCVLSTVLFSRSGKSKQQNLSVLLIPGEGSTTIQLGLSY